MSNNEIAVLAGVLRDQSVVVERLMRTTMQLQDLVLTQQAALYSLIATHGNPRGLFDEFATHLDRSAPKDGEELDDPLRAEMQRMQEKIRQAATNHPR